MDQVSDCNVVKQKQVLSFGFWCSDGAVKSLPVLIYSHLSILFIYLYYIGLQEFSLGYGNQSSYHMALRNRLACRNIRNGGL